MARISNLKYEDARAAVLDRLRCKTWREGERLPALPALAREFNVSVWAMDRALQELVAMGVLFRLPKKGTFVRHSSLVQAFEHAPVALAGITPAHWTDTVFMGPLLQSFADAAGPRPWFFFPYSDESEIILRLKREGVAALIAVIPTVNNFPALERIAASGIGVLSLCERVESDGLHFITMDNYGGVRAGLEYLAQLGHRRIGFFALYTAVKTMQERVQAFVEHVARLGLDRAPELAVLKDPPAGVNAAAAEALDAWLAMSPRPTAIFCASGLACSAMLAALAARSILFPRDISLLTFDDLPNSAQFVSPLTAIRLPVREMRGQAARLLPAIAAGLAPPARMVLPVELVVRASCAPAQQ